MSDIRKYTVIYVALLVLATAKVAFHGLDLGYGMFVGIIGVLAVMKIGLIAGWFQHLIDEPRSISYMMATAFFMVLLLVAAAGYSIQGT
ncbi:cytochrome C oxidase subunit IV family protein [Halovivax cerinus]|uniref:Cytochrome C oxidase subunit IV family protein n=1 Tax=Halovivax cerinus TaxID=1487865 RepID=A0ABD5NP17_9EURY|nr:cytochrome C oxidase subunit IV family protein [Halovivax cerinus]